MQMRIQPIAGQVMDSGSDRGVSQVQKQRSTRDRRRREGRGRPSARGDVVTLSGKAPGTPVDPEEMDTG